ncbi:MAG: ATP-binding protein [Candidatus Omnitrophota bacterium]
MKISTKILGLITFFLLILAFNGIISMSLLKGVGRELHTVVNKDVVLMQAATMVAKQQQQKAIIFERLRRITEELAYQTVNPARKEHLLFHIKLAKKDFDALGKDGALNIVNAKNIMAESIKTAPQDKTKLDLNELTLILKEIEKAHIHYDTMAENIFRMIDTGQYEISAEDINQIQTDERKLASELQKLLDKVQAFTEISVVNAQKYESTSQYVLWAMFFSSLLAGLALVLSIIRSINEPLRHLLSATHQIGQGNLSVKLNESSRDELGELSREFNRMSTQLSEARAKLEEQSKVLQFNLDLTAQQKKDLEKINQELDRFVHTVSHDIRSPLMGIAWYAEFLKSHCYAQLDKKGQDSVIGVHRGVDRCNALINDLLALTRISRIKNPYQEAPILGMLDDVLATLEYKIKQNKVDIQVDPLMPVIFCDPIKLKEVFLNLLTNAIKFSSGNPDLQPKITVTTINQTEHHEFIVKDNGIGIPPEHHDDIFAIFKRLDISEKYEGTGAGLSIVKSVIDDHGGKIWVISQPGQGSEFHFLIPKKLQGFPSA